MNQLLMQGYLFQRIKERMPADASLADKIAELLYISIDSAYRRIRGETPIVLEEARILCEAFNISLDQLLHIKKDSILFTSVKIDHDLFSFENYLGDILDKLKRVASYKQKEIIYLSKDFVLFHNFLFRPLFAFRYFFWMKSVLQHPDFRNARFSESILTCKIENIGKEIIKLYSAIPSVEIWSAESLDGYIEQIEYYRDAGYFQSGKDVEKVYEALRNVIEHMRIQTELGCKFLPGENGDSKKANFQVYRNRLVLGDNIILVLGNGKKTLYLNYDVLNYVSTEDEDFCNNIYKNIQTFMRRATMISNVSEKQRNVFFNTLIKKIPDA